MGASAERGTVEINFINLPKVHLNDQLQCPISLNFHHFKVKEFHRKFQKDSKHVQNTCVSN